MVLLALLAFTILLATKRSANPHIPGWRRQRRWRRLTQRRRGGRFRGCGGSLQARAPLNIHIQQAALYSLALISQQKQYQKFEIESIYFNLFDFISKLEICEDLLTPECFFARIRIIKPNYCPQKIQKNNGDSKDNILCIWGIFLNKNCKQILTGAKQKDEISSTM